MNDILPPKRPLNQTTPPKLVEPVVLPASSQAEPENQLSEPVKPKRSKVKIVIFIVAVLIGLLVGSGGSAYAWYQGQLKPVSSSSKQVRLTIKSGMKTNEIAKLLKQNGLIRSEVGFDWYTRLNKNADDLQAGTYSLSPNMSLSEIIGHLTEGKTDTMTITFLPGATLAENKQVLRDVGYSDQEINQAFSKVANLQLPVLTGKPRTADLEGYIYGETYQFPSDATVETIILRSLDQLERVVETQGLVAKYKAHNLSLYQGITLASIVQREVATNDDMRQVAQVFYLRLEKDMALGSDVTYQYGAKKLGVSPTPDLESAYNTRIHSGLPPGPIATPGESALKAVADPALGDYLYFVSGDDDKTYFAKTNEEHEQNVADHCHKKCQIL